MAVLQTARIGAKPKPVLAIGSFRCCPLKMVYRGGCGSALDAERASPSVAMNGSKSGDLEHRGRSDEMAHFVGLDVSVKETSVCVVDDAGKVVLEQKVPTEPDAIIALLTSLGATYG